MSASDSVRLLHKVIHSFHQHRYIRWIPETVTAFGNCTYIDEFERSRVSVCRYAKDVFNLTCEHMNGTSGCKTSCQGDGKIFYDETNLKYTHGKLKE